MTTAFAHPDRLWLLIALIPCAAWVARGTRRRDRDWVELGQSGRPSADGSWSWLCATILLILALAQPRWGRTIGQDSPPGHDLVLLVDASRSMAAEDAVPDRMGVAIATGIGLLEAMRNDPGNRAAVVAFAGRGVVRCPLTGDLDAAIDALRAIRPGDVDPGGTDLGAGLEAALAAFDDEEHAEGRAIVVFSDGEDHAGRWTQAIGQLRAEGVVVHSVAIGDPDQDHPVPDRSTAGNPSGRRALPRPGSRRSDVVFQALAKATGGAFLPIGLAPIDLGSLYRDRIEPTARRHRDGLRLPDRMERFPIFVLSALVIGLAGSWPGRSRRRSSRRGRRWGWSLTAMAILLGSLGAGQGGETTSELIERGRAEFDSSRFEAALARFEKAEELAPMSPIPLYDSAATLFRLRRFPEAIARYGEARSLADPALAIKIDFALGNALLASGDLPTSLAHYDACIASTDEGSNLDVVRRDATINRAFVAERIKPPPPSSGSEGTNDRDPGQNRPQSDRDRRDADRSPPGKGSTAGRSKRPGGNDPAPPGGARGSGGAGGEGEANPEPGSPGARLDEALRDVRESRARRPPDPPSSGSASMGKDW